MRQFYALSKTHHPDHNPDDPSASRRFVRVSEAYATLGNAQKRERYDRELHRASPRGRPHGSHSSTSSASGPAGGRPASGLSRRRTAFHGPPPSFYRSGAWGAQGAKRRRGQAQAAEPGPDASSSSQGQSQPQSQFHEHSPWPDDSSPIPHFDRAAHFRTQEEQDRRRRLRAASAEDAAPPRVGRGMLANFAFVGGIVALAALLPSVVLGAFARGGGREEGERNGR
ncbi:MAG: hypothetical protein M1832_000022 [Thelocarpon impressellum]|nr:MAG: hypothetical protein M1832_000022 [Thelocarpon impressellum]